jgi:hypothetical protein
MAATGETKTTNKQRNGGFDPRTIINTIMKTPTPEKLERKALKLWSLRLIDPRAPQYALAEKLWENAQQIRKCNTTITAP